MTLAGAGGLPLAAGPKTKRRAIMPGPEESTQVRVGEEAHFRLTASAELELRVQCLERVISRIPIAGFDYAQELQRAGLRKLNINLTAHPRPF